MDEIRLHVIPCTNEEMDPAGGPARAFTVTAQEFSDLIDRVNPYFAPAGIKFLFDSQFDWAPRANTAINTDSGDFRDQCNALAADLPGKLLCVLRWGPDEDQTGNGNAYPPPGAGPKPASVDDVTQNYVSLPSGLFDFELLNQGNGAFVAHEFGHFFGLYHTFPGWSALDPIYSGLPDPPSKNQAVKALGSYIMANGGTIDALDGDLLSDTPPDPNPQLWKALGAQICTTGSIGIEFMVGPIKKSFTFTPDPNNLMSYFSGCPDANAPGPSKMKFSPQQVQRIRDTLQHKSRTALTATPAFGHHSLQIGNATAPGPARLQVVATDGGGRVWFAHWDSAKNGGKWDRWRPVLPDTAPGGAQVRVVARDPTRLDLFIADTSGAIQTGARSQSNAGGQWLGWWSILTGETVPGGAVTAVSRFPDQLDAFVAGKGGGIYTAAWNKAADTWAGWWQIGVLMAPPGAPVTAVSRGPKDLDIFVAANDGKIYATAWSAGANAGKWRPWKWVAGGMAQPGTTVSAVSRFADQLDLFVVGTDGGIYTAAWNKNDNQGAWAGWWRIGTLTAPPGGAVTAISRANDSIDIFVVGFDGKVHWSGWSPKANGGKWRAWEVVLNGDARNGSAVAAVARTSDKIDIFAVRKDGGLYSAAWAAGTWKGWWRLS